MENIELIKDDVTFHEVIDRLRHVPKGDAERIIADISQESLDKITRNTIADDRPLGLIKAGLRALKTKKLLDPLENKIGPARLLNLLTEKGTFFELIHILRYASDSLNWNLMKNLSSEITGRLVDRAVAGKFPINSFRRELNLLYLLCGGFDNEFRKRIGVDNILKLILNNGNLGVISELNRYFPPRDIWQLKLIETFNALPGNKKEEFILRGDFFKYCSAMVDCKKLDIFHERKRAFSESELSLIDQLIRKSTYKSINRGLGALSHFPNKGLKLTLFRLAADYAEKAKTGIINNESASEKIAFISILNRVERLDKNSIVVIAASIDEDQFFGEKDFIGSLQLLQYIIVANDTELWFRDQILNLSNSNKIINKLGKQTVLNTFLYLWNTYALFVQEDLEDFSEWLNPGIVDAVYRVLEKYKTLAGNAESTRHLLMLVGLLEYLNIDTQRIKKMFPRGFKFLDMSRVFLAGVLEHVTFIPGFFYLRGINYFAKQPLFPNKWKLLSPRLYDVNLNTKGVMRLVESFQEKIKTTIL